MSRALAVAILTLVIAAALWVALALKAGPAPQQQTVNVYAPITCMPDDETRERVRTLMLEALDSAFRSHVEHTVEVWMRDSREQPARAANGVRAGIRSYVSTRDFIVNWHPVNC